MALDRLIALIFLIIALVYGFAAFNYQLLPFERNAPVLPNTLPKALSIIGALIAMFILLAPRTPATAQAADPDQNTDSLNLVQTGLLVLAMILYALFLRPIGFIGATALFIVGTACLLGERRWLVLLPVALVATLSVWFLVQEVLGIFLKPWPVWLD